MIQKKCIDETDKIGEKGKTVKGTFKRFLYVVASILGVFALVIFVVTAFFRVAAGDLLAQQEKEIADLEEYYQNGDYENLCEYYRSIGKSGGDYEKYNRICELYEDMKQGIKALEKMEDYGGEKTEYLQECLDMSMETLAEINDMESLGFPYGEDEGAMYIKQQYTEALNKYTLLTLDEIATAANSYADNQTDYMELAEIAIQRLEEQRQ